MPCFIAHKSSKLLIHCRLPPRITKSFLQILRFTGGTKITPTNTSILILFGPMNTTLRSGVCTLERRQWWSRRQSLLNSRRLRGFKHGLISCVVKNCMQRTRLRQGSIRMRRIRKRHISSSMQRGRRQQDAACLLRLRAPIYAPLPLICHRTVPVIFLTPRSF